MIPEYQKLCNGAKTNLHFQEICNENQALCQFILDPASFNLKNRVHMNDPILAQLFKLSRDYCYAINSVRMKLLKSKDITSEK